MERHCYNVLSLKCDYPPFPNPPFDPPYDMCRAILAFSWRKIIPESQMKEKSFLTGVCQVCQVFASVFFSDMKFNASIARRVEQFTPPSPFLPHETLLRERGQLSWTSNSHRHLLSMCSAWFQLEVATKSIPRAYSICPETITEAIRFQFLRCKNYVTAAEISSPRGPIRQKLRYRNRSDSL